MRLHSGVVSAMASSKMAPMIPRWLKTSSAVIVV
jgi:hypothetical protein